MIEIIDNRKTIQMTLDGIGAGEVFIFPDSPDVICMRTNDFSYIDLNDGTIHSIGLSNEYETVQLVTIRLIITE